MSVLRTFVVTVANPGSGNRYYIDGVLQDTVNIAEGGTYRFDQSDSSNSSHPLRFSITSDGTHGGGSEYTTGVTTVGTPGSSGAYTEITVATSAPTLYYYCSHHSGMGGQANTPASDSYGVLPWNFGNWAAQGDSFVQVTGLDLNVSEGSVDSVISIGWGAQYWGAGEWGELASPEVSVTGQSLTPSVASVTVTANADVSVTSVTATPTLGTAVGGSSIDLTLSSLELTSSEGSVFGGELNVVQVTSPSDDPWGNTRVGWGNGLWGNGDGVTLLGDAEVEAQADANVNVTGQELQSTAATVVAGISIVAEVTNGSENAVEFTAQGNAALSTDQAKFGVSSLELDGTDDIVDSNTNIDLSSGDFTIDVWIRPNNVSGYKGIWESGTSSKLVSYLLGNTVYLSVGGSTIISNSVTVNANEWTMLSYEREGNTHRIYKNGTLEDTDTASQRPDNGIFSIGESTFADFNGYIDEFRLSGVARYSGSSFTEPTGAFIPDSDTTFLLHFDGANGSTNIVDDSPGQTISRFDIGEHFAGEVVEVQVTTASTQPWGELAWGDGDWGQSVGTDVGIGGSVIITPSLEVPVTGIDINSTAGTLGIKGDANISLTGQQIETLQGNENAFTDVDIQVSGQELTSELNDVVSGISQLVIPTGVTATGNSGTMGTNAWAVVEPSASTTWSVVDKAAA